MGIFLSTYINKLDKKGRISVPSAYRSVIAEMGESFPGIIIYPSFVNKCLEACTMSRMQKISETIDNLDPFTDERNAFATSILASSYQLPFDSEGRVILPENLVAELKLEASAAFVGKGATFEIWEPSLLDEYIKEARNLASKERGLIKFHPTGGK